MGSGYTVGDRANVGEGAEGWSTQAVLSITAVDENGGGSHRSR
jgi:hypothetical protein